MIYSNMFKIEKTVEIKISSSVTGHISHFYAKGLQDKRLKLRQLK